MHHNDYNKIAEVNEISVIMPHILKHFNINNSKQVLECLPNTGDHISLNNLRVALAKLGVGSSVDKTSNRTLNKTGSSLPWLIISSDFPIIFVTKHQDGLYTYIDAISGKETSTDKLPISNNINIVFFHSMTQHGLIDDSSAWYQRLFSRYKSSFLSLFIASTILSLMALIIPLSIMALYDLIIPAKSMNLLYSMTIGLCIISLFGFFIDIFRSKVSTFLNLRINATINEIIISKLISLPAKMTENASISSQILKLKDLSSIHNFFTRPWFMSIFEVPCFLLFSLTIAIIGKDLVIYPVIGAIAHVIMYYFVRQSSIVSGRKSFILSDKHLYNTAETFTHIETIKYNGKESNWLKRYHKSNHAFCENSYETTKRSKKYETLSSLITFASTTCITLVGTLNVIDGSLSVGGLLACMILGWMSIAPFNGTLKLLFGIGPIKSHLNQIQKMLKLPSEYHPYYPYSAVDNLNGNIKFKNTSFKYQGDNNPAIRNLNIEIPNNTTNCIIGSNGSGKSTLLKLLTRLYDNQIGSILIDDTNIKQYTYIEYQKNIGYLPEKVSVLPGKIIDILKLDNPSASITDIYAACKKANVLKEIQSLPDEFNTIISEEDKTTCKTVAFIKKLYLARLYVKSPSIYLFDEPTTYLSEQDIDKLIEELNFLRDRATILIVTHVPERFDFADNILVLESGESKYFGTMSDFHKLSANSF